MNVACQVLSAARRLINRQDKDRASGKVQANNIDHGICTTKQSNQHFRTQGKHRDSRHEQFHSFSWQPAISLLSQFGVAWRHAIYYESLWVLKCWARFSRKRRADGEEF